MSGRRRLSAFIVEDNHVSRVLLARVDPDLVWLDIMLPDGILLAALERPSAAPEPH